MYRHQLLTITLALIIGSSIAGCSTINGVRGLKDKSSKTGSSVAKFKGYWNEDEDAKGSPRIIISLPEQRAKFYRGDTLVGEAPVSTGREGFETKSGDYKVLAKVPKHFSNLYGEFINSSGKVIGHGSIKDTPPAGATYSPSPMPYYLRLSDDGTGLHAGFLPGYPASHGCIRLPSEMAQKFFENTPIGTPVTIED